MCRGNWKLPCPCFRRCGQRAWSRGANLQIRMAFDGRSPLPTPPPLYRASADGYGLIRTEHADPRQATHSAPDRQDCKPFVNGKTLACSGSGRRKRR
ncbi:MAG: hypothetical protein AVDCRST_MAG87-3557 [uncultured Thermomicrobiales bacterium]|uniref:Uncharacterized protein n=1 Tax=uncultured Thermomicrobiales bacterium TaxID=1645740 RepID=A0A6J4VLZ4_9BACT|nr:MAG: hypothetical protein AVDCRST_MAG87-3557 [uncultured Thermomicrobiales bacterium]